MSTIGERLREERERLGMSQTALGAIGGVLKQAQLKYEQGSRMPDAAYLAAVASQGVDVVYVLTGNRPVAPVATMGPVLSERERTLIEHYRETNEVGRKAIEATGYALAHPGTEKKVSNGGQ